MVNRIISEKMMLFHGDLLVYQMVDVYIIYIYIDVYIYIMGGVDFEIPWDV